MRLGKAYHLGMPTLRRARTRDSLMVLLLTAAAIAFSPASGDAWLIKSVGSVHAAQAVAAPPNASQNPPVMAASARRSEPDPALAGKQPALRTQLAELLQLANELQSDVDKTNKDTLSLSVVRKADRIEKLARSMRAEKQVRGPRDH